MNQLRLLLAALLVAGCASAAPENAVKEHTLTLQPQQSTAVGSATLRFDRIEDSRCPPNVQCVSAGKLSYRFTLSGGQAPESFSLDSAAPAHLSSSLPGVRIILQNSEPPAVAAAGTPPTPHPVTLSVTLP